MEYDYEKIARMKFWCEENYENGADTMIECWVNSDYQRVLDDHDGDLDKAMELLADLASIYKERQNDADYHARGFF
jgi:hypothetical protein